MKDFNLNSFLGQLEEDRKMKNLEDLMETTVSVVSNVCQSDYSLQAKFKDVLQICKEYKNVQDLKGMSGWKHCGDSHKENIFDDHKKHKTPAFLLSTYVVNGTSVKGLSRDELPKNSYMIIDIDNINPSPEILEDINNIPIVLGTGISCSGTGYWCIIRFEHGRIKSKEDWDIMFSEITDYFLDWGYEIDKSCKNINRLRVCSPYDIEWSSEWETYYPKLIKVSKESTVLSTYRDLSNLDFTITNEGRIFKERYVKGEMYTKRYQLSNTIYNLFGDGGKDLFYSIVDDGSDHRELDGIWNRSRSGEGHSCNWVIRKLQEYGWIEQIPVKSGKRQHKIFTEDDL